MSDFQQIEKLIRLKRFEAPSEDFVEDFLVKFRERQRSEMLRQSAHGLLLERLDAYFHDFIMPKWTMAAATAGVAILAGWGTLRVITDDPHPATAQFAFHSADLGPSSLLVNAQQAPALGVDSPLIPKVSSPDQVEIESVVLLSRHFESDALRMEVFNLPGVSSDLNPASYSDFMPVSSLTK